MDHLDHPSLETWEARRHWFESLNEATAGQGGYMLSEQACAITADVQAAFCAGAWVAVIVLSMSVIDAHLREVEAPDFRGNTKQLIDLTMDGDSTLQRLRKRRNALVHVDADQPAITVDQQWTNRAELEAEAREAVRLMFKSLYSGPWV